MPRILPALTEFFTHKSAYVSNNDRLIVSDYSDAEYRQFYDEKVAAGHISKRRIYETRSPVIVSSQSDPECVKQCSVQFETKNTSDIDSVKSRSYLNNQPTGSFMNDFCAIANNNVRIKPTYADCWLVGNKSDLEKIADYDTPSGKVLIGTAMDGETEYNLTPIEYSYPDSLNAVIGKSIEGVRETYRNKGGRMDKQTVLSTARGLIMDSSDTVEAVYGSDTRQLEAAIEEMCDIVYRYTVGLGVFDTLMADPKLEDIYIDAPCEKNRIHVTMNGISGVNSHIRCRTNLIVDKKEVMNLVNILKRESNLPFCESNPILETDIKAHDARATVVGYPMSPNGDAVAIRKHSTRPWTLTRLIANGTIDPKIAGLLSFFIDNRATFLICGARGAGKSSLLSSLMFEFPMSQRILTIEDTMELPGEKMRKMGYKVQSMLIDDRMDGSDLSRADEALRVSLRMGESAIILGEVRGEEAKTLYQSMRTGRAGSSIMGTIHGDSAKSVYERVVHDMNIAPEAFMATEILVTLGTVRDRRTGNQIRKMNEIVATGEHAGDFIDIADSSELFTTPVMRRVMTTSQQSKSEIMKEIRARASIRSYLADVGNKFGEEYFGPEWIGFANDHVSRSQGKTAEEVLESFKVKFCKVSGIGE